MTAAGTASAREFWQSSLDALQAELHTGGSGLDEAEAARRLADDGPNVPRPRPRKAVLLQFLSRFGNPLVLLLLAAAAISAFTGDVPSFVIIAIVVAMSVTLDFVQEQRAGKAAEKLRQSVALHATVMRGGRPLDIPADQIVRGDVVLLKPGGLIPADGRVLEARDFFVNQGVLTGEAYPVEKHVNRLAETGSDLGAVSSALFMGTSALSGTATMLVCRTGSATAFGEISESLINKPPATAFENGLRSFSLLIVRIAILMVLFVLLVNGLHKRPWLQSFTFAVALAVGLTPELLPMVVSVTLARGATRLAKQRVIVRRLPAVHDLGSMDVLCSDKTGTLTQSQIRLEKHLDPLGRDGARVLDLAFLNSSMETGLRNPLDDAILSHTEVDVSAWRKIDEVHFDFERRRVSVLADNGTERVLILKGAFEDVLVQCTSYESDGPENLLPLDDAARSAALQRFQSLSREGFRVLGIAWKRTAPDQVHAVVNDETELVFAGFVAFADPPKPGAAEALRALAASGVTVKIVTGDNELVTRHVCAELGLPVAGVLTGDEIQAMTDPVLAARAESVNLFCRVAPSQKYRVIQALRSRNHVVGYLGDGINDAPSLHSADVGISVSGAVDVAKEAADLILLDQDLGVLHDGVLEGRRTYANIMKYIMMGTSSNFGNMFSMAGATLVLPFLPMLPVQILVNNFLYDVSEVPIPLDRVDSDSIAKPRRWNVSFIRSFMIVIGLVSSIFDFVTFYILRHVYHAGEQLFHTGWFIESLATQVLVVFVIRTRGNPFASKPSSLLTATALAVVGVAAALPFTGLGDRLGFVPVPGAFFLTLGGIVVAYLTIVQGVKTWFYHAFWTE